MYNLNCTEDNASAESKGAVNRMNGRQKDILKELCGREEFVTVSQLAEIMKVSVKTVRNDLSVIKDEAVSAGGELETKPHIGVRLLISEEGRRKLAASENDDDREIFFFIVRRLLKNSDLTAAKLAERYYIGRNHLDKILERVSEWFSDKHILFEIRRGKGLKIRYSELNYRLAVCDFYNEFSDMYEKLIAPRESMYAFMSGQEYTALCALLDGFEADNAAQLIIQTEEEFGIAFNYLSDIRLLLLTSLCIIRTRSGNTAEELAITDFPSVCESDLAMMRRLSAEIEARFNMTLPESEKSFLAFALSISEIQDCTSDEARRSFEQMNFGLCRFTVKIVNLVSDIVGMDLRKDMFFVRQMLFQLKSMTARLKFGITAKNQLLAQIKEKYPNMMAAAWLLGNIFEKELSLEINENEIAYLALHIGGAIERRMLRLSACIVCDYGIGISQILRERLVRTIPELDITDVYSVRDIRRIKSEQCDFVITTTPLGSYRLNKPVAEIGHLLGENDVETLRRMMKEIRVKKHGEMKRIAPKTAIFRRELIFAQTDEADKTRLLKKMCERLEVLGYVTDGFLESVLEREKSTSTDIGKGFAIPHGLSEYVNHSAAVFASLKHPMQWSDSGEEVSAVFLLAFDLSEDKDVKDEIIGFYKSIVTFMENDSECAKLKTLSDKEDILKILEKW